MFLKEVVCIELLLNPLLSMWEAPPLMRYVDCVQIWVMYGFELCGDFGHSLEGSVYLKLGTSVAQRDGPPVMYDSSNGVHFLTSVQENTGEIDSFGQGRWYDGKNQRLSLPHDWQEVELTL